MGAAGQGGEEAGGQPDGGSQDDPAGGAGWQEVEDSREGRRRSRRRIRRGGRTTGKTVDITILNNNLNGFNGKKASIQELFDIVKPTVATFQETAVAGSNKIKLKNYYCFQRNRKGVKQMGGVATFVLNEVKANTLKVKEGEDNEEYLITRLEHVSPPVNITNDYGGQESRMSREDILESWAQLRKEIKEIEECEEGLVCIGDYNRAIGDDELGVAGNHP